MQYAIVIEKSLSNYAAYGCVATGASREEALHVSSAAIRLHIESLREHHEPVPEPRCTTAVVDVAAVAG